jgi:hypothetical protein
VPLNTVPGLYHPPGYKGGRRDSNPAWVPGNTSLRLVSRMTPGRLLGAIRDYGEAFTALGCEVHCSQDLMSAAPGLTEPLGH